MQISNLKEMLLNSVKQYGNNILYRLEDKEITYKEMYEYVNCLGTALIDLGLKNKKIAILSENRYEWEISYFSITCGTGVVVPLDKTLTKKEIITILKRAEVKAIFCSKKYEEILLSVKKDIESLKYIICFDGNSEISYTKLIENGSILIQNGNAEFINSQINNNELGFIMFTSGTTEKSKAVMLSHENICSNLLNVEKQFPIESKDIALSVLPLNHVLEGLFCLLITIYKGATRTYCYDLKNIIEDINKYQISFMGAVPVIFEYIYKRIDEINKENIKIFMSGGAKLKTELEKNFNDNNVNLVQGYGITETSPVISMSNLNFHKFGSVGKIIPNIEIQIINKDDYGIGEILVKGKNVFLGYYQDEESTNSVLKDGWFYTGDLGKVDSEGYLFLYGRTKNMIVLPNGKKVFPEELEMLINKIDGVKESFVFERKDVGDKVLICAKIVYKDLNQVENIQNMIMNINENLPIYKQISKIYVTTEELLKTSTGKIKRNEEVEKIKLENFNNFYNLNNSNNETESIIKKIIINQLGSDIENNMTFDEMGADSLDKVEIIFEVEKNLNITIDKKDYSKINSIKDIINYIKMIRNI